MKNEWIWTLLGVCASLAAVSDVHAQLFGNRRSGSTASRREGTAFHRSSPFNRVGAGSNNQAGPAVTGGERFVRGNRRTNDFVGADSMEQQSFIGMQQGRTEGRIASAISALRIRSDVNANRGKTAAERSRTEMYEPRLTIGFDFTPPPAQSIAAELTRQLESTSVLRKMGRIEVSVQGRTATLRGEVASERERTVAELVALFEPGISQVQNDLTVKSPPLDPPAPHPGEGGPSSGGPH